MCLQVKSHIFIGIQTVFKVGKATEHALLDGIPSERVKFTAFKDTGINLRTW